MSTEAHCANDKGGSAFLRDAIDAGSRSTIPHADGALAYDRAEPQHEEHPQGSHGRRSAAEFNALIESQKQHGQEGDIVLKHAPYDPFQQLVPVLVPPTRLDPGERSHEWVPDSVRVSLPEWRTAEP
jgi:hypothetical protein